MKEKLKSQGERRFAHGSNWKYGTVMSLQEAGRIDV
jgi:hypothetical protein